MPIPGPR
jgi:hypothetical protein